MIFGKKKHPKLFWVEAIMYAAIIIVCMLGSFGVFDAKGDQLDILLAVPPVVEEPLVEEPLPLDSCEKWLTLPSDLRINILRFGMMSEMRKAKLGPKANALTRCLGESDNLQSLDFAIVAECNRSGEENLAPVFNANLERIVFKCLKWSREEMDE